MSPRRPDFELIVRLMMETGVLDHYIAFDQYVDTRFAEGAAGMTPWRYEAGSTRAE